MAKKILTQDTTNYNNVQALPDLVEDQSTLVRQTFDKAGNDQKTFMNSTHIPELQSSTTGTSGSYGVGHGSASIAANNVGDALEENRQAIDTLELADGQNVKLTGNQTVAGTKTFSSNVVVPTTPTLSTHATSKEYVDSKSPLTVPDNSITNLKLATDVKVGSLATLTTTEKSSVTGAINEVDANADQAQSDATEANNKLDNSFYADLNAYYGNTKLADDMQDSSLYGITGGTLSDDTTNFKLGGQSIRLTEIDNTAGNIIADKDNIALDYTKLNNGETSGDEDFINFIFYVSDATFANEVSVQFGQDAVFSAANRKYYIISSGIVDGWNYFKIPKSDFLTVGTGAWDGIQSLRVLWESLDNAQNEYVSFQLIQLVKKDSILAIPNPFQRNGVVDFNINSGEWFAGKERGRIKAKLLDVTTTAQNLLQGVKTYSNFVAELTCDSVGITSDTAYLSAYEDANNQIYAVVLNDNLTLTSIVGGSPATVTNSFAIQDGDIVNLKLERNGNNIIATAYKNGDINNIVTVSDTRNLSTLTELSLAIGANSTIDGTSLYQTSITEIPHAHHADIAEVAKTIPVKYQSGAFVSDELNYGELGIDTANNRLYMKYSATQVIYFTGTVV